MSSEPVPDDVRDLIIRHIDTVAQLEALLLLRAHSAESWLASSVAKRLYAPEGDIVRMLARLCSDGFLLREQETYRYECSADKRKESIGWPRRIRGT